MSITRGQLWAQLRGQLWASQGCYPPDPKAASSADTTRRLKVKAQLAKSLDQVGVERLWTCVLQPRIASQCHQIFSPTAPTPLMSFHYVRVAAEDTRAQFPSLDAHCDPNFFSRTCSCSPHLYTVYTVYTVTPFTPITLA